MREGTDDVLSRRAHFSISCVHGIKQQPVLISSLQNQRLTAQDGDTVPLQSVRRYHDVADIQGV